MPQESVNKSNMDYIEEGECEEKRVVHIRKPLSFTVTHGYDYRRASLHKTLRTWALRKLIRPILWFIDGLFLGLHVEGRENIDFSSGAVTVCNHIHPMDCTMIDLAFPRRRMYYMTLPANFNIPVVRKLIRVLGGIPLAREPLLIKELFQEMGIALDKGAYVQVYPEGVLIPYCDNLRKFYDGAFLLAVREHVPVVPMVLKQAPPSGFLKLCKRKPCFHLKILSPIYAPEGVPLREASRMLGNQCRIAMEKELNS